MDNKCHFMENRAPILDLVNPDLDPVWVGWGRSGPVGDVNVPDSVSLGSPRKSGVPMLWKIRVVIYGQSPL